MSQDNWSRDTDRDIEELKSRVYQLEVQMTKLLKDRNVETLAEINALEPQPATVADGQCKCGARIKFHRDAGGWEHTEFVAPPEGFVISQAFNVEWPESTPDLAHALAETWRENPHSWSLLAERAGEWFAGRMAYQPKREASDAIQQIMVQLKREAYGPGGETAANELADTSWARIEQALRQVAAPPGGSPQDAEDPALTQWRALAQALAALEWSEDEEGGRLCAACPGTEKDGHDAGCPTGRLLRLCAMQIHEFTKPLEEIDPYETHNWEVPGGQEVPMNYCANCGAVGDHEEAQQVCPYWAEKQEGAPSNG